MTSRTGSILAVVVLTVAAVAACGTRDWRPAAQGTTAESRQGSATGSTLSSAAAIGLDPATTSSKRLCDALRTTVNDNTFGKPLTTTEVIDYEPGRSSSSILVSCLLGTDDVQTSSHRSGGGTFQRGLAKLSMSGPYLVDGKPSNHPSSWFLDGGRPGCQGQDNPQLGTAAATVWCLEAGTAMGSTVMYFTDLILEFEMQAPRVMTTGLTFDKFLAARDTVLTALAQR